MIFDYLVIVSEYRMLTDTNLVTIDGVITKFEMSVAIKVTFCHVLQFVCNLV